MSKYKLSILSASSPVALEPRLLFDGAAAADVIDAFDEAEEQQTQHDPNSQTEPGTSDGNGLDQDGTTTGIYVPQSMAQRLGLDGEPESIETAQQEKALIIIDARVENHELLINSLPENSQYIIIEEFEAGLELINQALEVGGGNYDSIHIISHGTPGSFSLGTDLLNNNTFNQHTEQLQAWSQYLNEGADILLYGCDIAQGDIGQSFVTELAAITGADIAASTNATGDADQGGDWVLESETGPIEADVFEIEGYVGLLDSSEATGNVSGVENTADDKTAAVGEDDGPAKVLDKWQVTGSGQITVAVTGAAKGSLSHTDGGDLTFTGTATQINDWLAGVQYQYKTDGQSEIGDADEITLTFTTLDSLGGTKTITKTQAINIAPQNDAPTIGDNIKLQVNEKGVLKFDAAEISSGGLGFTHDQLGITDTDNLAEQVIIKLTAIPDKEDGKFVLNGNTLEVGSTLSVADLENLTFVHSGKQVLESGNTISFTYTINDGAGGIVDNNTVEIELIPVNDEPAISGADSIVIIQGEGRVSLGNGGTLPVLGGGNIDRGQIVSADPDDLGVNDITYKITELPTVGDLYYLDTKIDDANKGTIEIKNLKDLFYEYPAGKEPKDLGAKPIVSFKMSATDSGGGAGQENSKTVNNITVDITILDNNNDPKLTKNIEQDYQELLEDNKVTDSSFVITREMLNIDDPDSFDSNVVFKITSKVDDYAGGYFTVNGKLLDQGSSFTLDDIDKNLVQYHLRYKPTGEPGEFRADSFSFTVTDSGKGIVFPDDGADPFARDGGIYDSDAKDAELVEHTFTVKVPTIVPEGNGEGTLPDLPAAADPIENSGNGKLDGVPESDGTADNTNGKPITDSMLKYSDGVSVAKDIIYRIEKLPATGSIWLDGKQLGQFDSFSQADVDSGKVIFHHSGGDASFTDTLLFTVSNGDVTTAVDGTLDITIVPQNDTPVASQTGEINLLEGESIIITGDHIGISDSDELATVDSGINGKYANDNDLWFVISEVPSTDVAGAQTGTSHTLVGKLQWNTGGDNWIDITDANKSDFNGDGKITLADLASGKLRYVHNGTEDFTDSFKIIPWDDQNVTGNDITDTNQSSEGAETTIEITVVTKNNAPVLQNPKQHLTGDHALYEGQKATIWGKDPATPGDVYGQLVYFDQDNTAIQTQFRVTKATEYGTLYKAGVALKVGSIFTQKDLDEGLITYEHNGGEGHKDSFEYTVSDGDFTVNDDGVIDSSGNVSSEYLIHIKPSNDKPEFSQERKNPLIVDGADSRNNIIKDSPFQIKDTDLDLTKKLDGNLSTGEVDLITVIVRVVGTDGKMLVLSGADKYEISVDDNWSTLGTTSVEDGYLQLTGTVADINDALKTLGVGFTSDIKDTYQLQVIVDDRLNSTQDGYQNGDTGVKANGGEQNQGTDGNFKPIDGATYDWADAVKTDFNNSLNINVAEIDLWVSTNNVPGEILTKPDDFDAEEDVPSKITGLKFQDLESEKFGSKITVTLGVNSGTLNVANLPDTITVNGDGGSTITLTGSVTDINNFLADGDSGTGVFYTTLPNINHDTNDNAAGDVSLTIVLEEGKINEANPGAGGSAIGGDTDGTGGEPNIIATKTVAITIIPVNDAPVVGKPASDLVTINSNNPFTIDGFKITDVDSNNGYADGEADETIQVIVRILDSAGNPLIEQKYIDAGIKFSSDNSTGVTVISYSDSVLRIVGKLADLQSYLDTLQIQFSKSGGANLDGIHKVEVIVDDRIRDTNGGFVTTDGKVTANGGAQNQDGIKDPLDIPETELDVYVQKVKGVDALNVFNVVSNSRDIFISSLNDPGNITATDVTVPEGSSTIKLTADNANIQISDPDHNNSTGMVTTVTVGKGTITDFGTLPAGVTVTGKDTGSIEITGATQDQINAILNNITITFPTADADSAGGADWNGSFEVTVVYNDKGNTGMRPDTLDGDSDDPASENGDYSYADDTAGSTDAALVTTRTITVTVTPVNDAPTVTDTTVVQLPKPSIEDTDGDTDGDGDLLNMPTVGDLFSDRFNDSKDNVTEGSNSDTFFGVVVVDNDAIAAQGSWQWFDGTAWQNISTTVSDSNALLLNADTQIRFNPADNFHGTPGELTVKLVEKNDVDDETSSEFDPLDTASTPNGSVIDLTVDGNLGETSLVSNDSINLQTTVSNVNDRPTGQDATLDSVKEDLVDEDPDNGPVGQTVDELFGSGYSDAVDNQKAIAGGADASDDFGGIAIVGNNADPATEGKWQYKTATGDWVDVVTDVSDTDALILSTTDSIRFIPVDDYNGTPGGLEVRLADSSQTHATSSDLDLDSDEAKNTTSTWSTIVELNTKVLPQNDRPALSAGGKTSGIEVSVTEYDAVTGNGNAFEVELLQDVLVSDLDLTTTDALESGVFGAGTITVTITDKIANDILLIDETLAGIDEVTAYDPTTGKLVIKLADGATIDQVQTILESVKYAHQSDDPTGKLSTDPERNTRNFEVELSDGNNTQTDGDAGGPNPLSTTISGTVTIIPLNDPPVATPDENGLLNTSEAPITGNVISGESKDSGGTDNSPTTLDPDTDPDTPTTKLIITGIKAAGDTGSTGVTDETEGTKIDGQYGTLTIWPNGEYSYELDQENSDVYGLPKDILLTEEFEYTLSDNDENSPGTSTATLTITITGDTPPELGITPKDKNGEDIDGQVTVYESGLPEGSESNTGKHKVDGEITVSTPSGFKEITIGGEPFDLDSLNSASTEEPLEVTTPKGKIYITGCTKGSGDDEAPKSITIHYTYELIKAPNNDTLAEATDKNFIEKVSLQATDKNNNSTDPVDLEINIVDDEPTALDDKKDLDNKTTVSGNALTGSSDGDVKDIQGADGATVTSIKGSEDNSDVTVPTDGDGDGATGKHGTLTIDKDGNYTYTRTNGDPLEATEVFEYTITDGDGDESTAKITIHIKDKGPVFVDKDNNPIDPTPVDPDDPNKDQIIVKPDGKVNESGLPNGSNPNTSDRTTTGTITFTPGDGDGNDHKIEITGKDGDPVLITKSGITVETPYGKVTITKFDPENGKITYSYELDEKTSGNDTNDRFELTVTDEDGDKSTVTVIIDIVDDHPIANPDIAEVYGDSELNVPAESGVLKNDKSGADGWNNDGAVVGVEPGTDLPSDSTNVGTPIEGEFGKLTLYDDGSYEYLPNDDNDTTEPALYDVFTYTVRDGDGDEVSTTLTIKVIYNTPPEAVDDSATTEEDTPVSGNLLTNDTDPDNDPLTVTTITVDGKTYPVPEDGSKITVTVPGKGKITVDKNGGYTFTPDPGVIGRVPDIGYTISDGNGGEDDAKLVINITPGNPPLNPSTPTPPVYDPYSPLNGPGRNGPVSIFDSSVVTDPSVFFAGERHDNVPRLPIPLHPIIYVNNEVAKSQNLREQADMRANASPDLVSPYNPDSPSLGAGLGQDPNLFVSHAISAAQQRAAMLDALVSGRNGRTDLSGDGMLHTPSVSEATPDQSQEARLRAQEAALRQAQQAAQKAAMQQAQQQNERSEQQKAALQEAMQARQEALRAQQEAAEQAAEDANSADNAESTSDDVSFLADEAPQQVASRSFSQQLRAAGTRLPMAKRDGIDI